MKTKAKADGATAGGGLRARVSAASADAAADAAARAPVAAAADAASPSAVAAAAERPLRADARRNRERVLAVALDLFGARGVAVEMDEIARQAGVGVGTIYRHFPTKEALFLAIVAGHIERLIAEAHAQATASDPGAAFFAFIERVIAEGVTKRHVVDVLSRGGFALACVPSGSHDDFRAALGLLLSRAQRAGAVRADIDAAEVLALVSGVFAAFERHGDVRSRRRILAVIHDGLRAPPR